MYDNSNDIPEVNHTVGSSGAKGSVLLVERYGVDSINVGALL